MYHRLGIHLWPLLLVLLAFATGAIAAPVSTNPANSDNAAQAAPAANAVPNSVNPELLALESAIAPVRFRERTLFQITGPIGELTAGTRAAAIESRLLAIAGGSSDSLQALRVVERDGLSEIHAGSILVRVITEGDAAGTGRTRRQLAADQLVLIGDALAVEFRDRTAAALMRGALLAALATLVAILLLVGLQRLYRWTSRSLRRAALAWHWDSSLARLSLITPANVSAASRSVAATLAWLIGIALTYLYLEYVLSLFPWTRGISDGMVTTTRAAVLSAASGLFDYVPNLLNIVVVVVIVRFALKGIRVLFDQISSERINLPGFYPEWALPTYSLVRFLLIAIAAVMIFPYLPGSGSEGFKGISVFVGLLISLGAASAIANVIGGIVLTYMRPFRIGDRVKIADAVGDIIDKDLFVVRLRTIKNVDITIPNSLVLANHIINFSSNAQATGLILHTTVTIGYDVPWPKVHELLLAATAGVEGIDTDPAPFVLQTSLNDFSVAYELNASTRLPNQMAVLYSRLHAAIQDRFNEAGVEIMSPHFTAVRDGNTATIPAEHLPKDYRAPGFNVMARLLRTREQGS